MIKHCLPKKKQYDERLQQKKRKIQKHYCQYESGTLEDKNLMYHISQSALTKLVHYS
jgi:hypothetical protein